METQNRNQRKGRIFQPLIPALPKNAVILHINAFFFVLLFAMMEIWK
jgi:hypothetical protein